MSRSEDGELRRAFAALRTAERDQAPPLGSLLLVPPTGRRRTRPTVLAWVGLAAAASLVALAGYRGVEAAAAARATTHVVQALGPFAADRWHSPTDPLLHTPGLELLVTVPAIAAVDSLPSIGVLP